MCLFVLCFFGTSILFKDPSFIYIQIVISFVGILSILYIAKKEIVQLKHNGIRDYLSSFWNIADVAFLFLYLFVYLPLLLFFEISNNENILYIS
jgi:hypothetical protein